MNTLKTLRHHRLDAQQLRTLGGPVTTRPGAVFLSRKDHGGRARGHVAGGGVKDGYLFAVNANAQAQALGRCLVQGQAALFA